MIFFCKFYQALINMLRIHRYLRLLVGKPFQRLLHSLFYLVAYIQCSQTAFIFNRCPDAFISKKIGDQGLLCFIQLMRMPKAFHCLFHLKKIAAGTSQIVIDLCCKPCLSLLQSFFFRSFSYTWMALTSIPFSTNASPFFFSPKLQGLLHPSWKALHLMCEALHM